MQVREGSVIIELSDRLFYNPHMEFCRDMSSLSVGAIGRMFGDRLDLCDGFTATGIRGIRYAKENPDVIERLTLVDANRFAKEVVVKNLKINGVEGEFVQDDIVHYVYGKHHTFVEIDPFGTPQPFIRPVISSFYSDNSIKTAYLSVTATDPAVLCGAHYKACVKLYHSYPLHTSFCHEVGIRILLINIMWAANEYDFGIEPLFSLSHRHFMKVLVRLQRGARYATDNTKMMGYLTYDPKEYNIEVSRFPMSQEQSRIGGPLWLGELHNRRFVSIMREINRERDYKNKEKLNKYLSMMIGEVDMPPYFYDTHLLAKVFKHQPIKLQDILDRLNDRGYPAVKTHFSPNGFKTRAPLEVIRECFTR